MGEKRYQNRMSLGIVIGIVIAGLSSCAGLNKQTVSDSAASSAQTASVSGNGSENETYEIGADDGLRIAVEQHPEWSGEYIVGPNGAIIIPSVGEFRAEGKTRGELERSLSDYLAKYINNPRVHISIVKYNSNVIYVLGEVNVPGKYSTEGKTLTLRDAVVKAGLPTRFAATSRVYLISASKGRPSQDIVNLYRILYRGELARNVVLKPGDIVYIPKSFLGKINDLISVIISPISSVRYPVVP